MNARLALVAVFALLLHPHLTGPAHGLSVTIPPAWIAAAAITLACLVLAWLASRSLMGFTVRRTPA
jgi:uncharacterized MAPEG superfamily protein